MIFYCIIGFIAFGFFVASISYSIWKRLKILNIKINRKKLLNIHCVLAILGTGFTLIHVILNFSEVRLSISYICLFSMMLVTTSGIILKFVKGISKYRKKFIFFHTVFTFVFFVSLAFHVIGYYLML